MIKASATLLTLYSFPQEMASSDHPAGAEALIKGLSKRSSGTGRFIHMSGSDVLVDLTAPPGAGMSRLVLHTILHPEDQMLTIILASPHSYE